MRLPNSGCIMELGYTPIVPRIAGATYLVSRQERDPGGGALWTAAEVEPDVAGVRLDFGTSTPTQKLPVDGAHDVGLDTEVLWTEASGSAYVTTFIHTGIGAGPMMIVASSRASIHLPDFSTLSAPLPRVEEYEWQTLTYDKTTLDDVVTVGLLPWRAGSGAASPIRKFTTR
jgi:hypothetical protein